MLREIIDKFYLDRQKDKEQHHFYITDAGKCPRQTFFKFKGYPRKEPEARILRVFEHGDYTHMKIMSTLFSLGIVRAAEIKIPSEEIISGRADAIVGIEGKPYVLEIKSSSQFKFTKLNAPEPDHLKQVQLYMHYFKVPQAILLYEDKNTQDLKEFIVQYDPDLVQEVLKDFEILKEQLDKNIIPPVPKDIESWRCDYCEYWEECQKVEKSKLKGMG